MPAQSERQPHIAWALLPTVFSLAWPTMLEQLMQTAVQYIDTAMVGSLGTQATAASAVSFVCGGIAITVAVFRHPRISPRGETLRPVSFRYLALIMLCLPYTPIFDA